MQVRRQVEKATHGPKRGHTLGSHSQQLKTVLPCHNLLPARPCVHQQLCHLVHGLGHSHSPTDKAKSPGSAAPVRFASCRARAVQTSRSLFCVLKVGEYETGKMWG